MSQTLVFVAHPLIKEGFVEDRAYQGALTGKIVEAPHLLVLPTGLGKTIVAARAIAHFLLRDPDRKALVLAPTKPLCDQHGRLLRQILQDVAVTTFTGETSPQQRDAAWAENRVVVATPQVIQNDLVRGARTLEDVGFVVYDEAHRATGHYPYGFIAQRYRRAGGRHAVGLTASPGNNAAAVQAILHNLNLERVEVRSEHDADVAPYVKDVATEWVRVKPTSAAVHLVRLLERLYGRTIVGLRRLGYLDYLRGLPSRKELLQLGQRLRQEASQRQGGRALYGAMSLQARAIKLQHALELAETQGTPSAFAFLQRLSQEAAASGGSKAARDLVREPEFAEAVALARDDPDPPPKQVRVAQLVAHGLAGGERRVLVFANYRETADALVAALQNIDGVRARRFVGHAASGGERGLTKREQQAVVEQFRNGETNVLVATAVGEEGLDLPEVDLVILHEPVPSAIRLVQRRGRTGRRDHGRLVVLLTEGTRDEAYHWNAVRRERQMIENLELLKRSPPASVVTAVPVAVAAESVPARLPVAGPGLEVAMDPREAGSALARALLGRGVRVRATTLDTGDFALSARVLVERKSATDFVASIKDGRLADQLPRLGRAERGILLIEGDPFRVAAGVTPAAIAGALASAANDHGVSVITVPDADAGADFLVSLARREHREGRNRPLRALKTPASPDAKLRFVLEGIPHVGPVVARALLERFGSVAAVTNASVADLEQTPGVGVETARAIHEVLHRTYMAAASGPPIGQTQLGMPTLEGGNRAAR